MSFEQLVFYYWAVGFFVNFVLIFTELGDSWKYFCKDPIQFLMLMLMLNVPMWPLELILIGQLSWKNGNIYRRKRKNRKETHEITN